MLAVVLAIVAGCDPGGDSEDEARELAGVKADAQDGEASLLEAAEARFRDGDLKAAETLVYRGMVENPDDPAGILLASQIEVRNGRLKNAVEMLSDIPPTATVYEEAIMLRGKLLIQLNDLPQAADVLLDSIPIQTETPITTEEQTRFRTAWSCLNRTGRRHEASELAEHLCQQGVADKEILLSLVSRGKSFPAPGMIPSNATTKEMIGLGTARRHFSLENFQDALDELKQNPLDPTLDGSRHSIAFESLRGRLLAETQSWDEFRRWAVATANLPSKNADYWAALGTYFHDNREYEASVHSLLQAVQIDPTDRLSIQRLSSVLAAIGRSDDSAQFRQRGVEIYENEQTAKIHYQSKVSPESTRRLAFQSMELGRPFETLAWSFALLPAHAIEARSQIQNQRIALLKSPAAVQMSRQTAMQGLQPKSFAFEDVWTEFIEQSRGDVANAATRTKSRVIPIKATPHLIDRARPMGLEFQWYKDFEIDLSTIPIHESLGGGIAVLDFDLDGWQDVYLAQGSGEPPTAHATRSNQFFRNLQTQFEDATQLTHTEDRNYSSGIASGDINQDGFPDLYLGSLGHNRMLINNGDGTFRDATQTLDSNEDRFSTSLAIADISGDGLPDLYEANYIEMDGGFKVPETNEDGTLVPPTPLSHYADSDRWFEALPTGHFAAHEITREIASPGTSLGLIVADFDKNGENEVFVGNDVRPNHWLIQNGNKSFVNVADSRGLANGFNGVANGCMGIATGDFDRDGSLDLQIANYSLEPANLFLQTSNGTFIDHSRRFKLADLTHSNVGFGTKALDFDRNGVLDFFVANGHIFDLQEQGEEFQMAPQILMGDGQRYELASCTHDSPYFERQYLGRSVALLDYDRDGATDLLVGHLDQPYALLHNETHRGEQDLQSQIPTTPSIGSWLQVELAGMKTERDAIGTRVSIKLANDTFSEWVVAGDGYLCSDEAVVRFEIPNTQVISQLNIQWPSGNEQTFANVKPNQRLLIGETFSEPWIR